MRDPKCNLLESLILEIDGVQFSVDITVEEEERSSWEAKSLVVCHRESLVREGQFAPTAKENQANGSDILGILGFKSQLPIQRGEIGGDVVTFQENRHENER